MLAPGHYALHLILGYPQQHRGINPDMFARSVRDRLSRQTGGKVAFAQHLPFNPFVQTYQEHGLIFTGTKGITAASMFIEVTDFVEERTIKLALIEAFWSSGGSSGSGPNSSGLVERIVDDIGTCGERPESRSTLVRILGDISSLGLLELFNADYIEYMTSGGTVRGCITWAHDSGTTRANFNSKVWNSDFRGFSKWHHTTAELPDQPSPVAPPQAQPQPQPQPQQTHQIHQTHTQAHGHRQEQPYPGTQPQALQPRPQSAEPQSSGQGFLQKPWVKPAIGVTVAVAILAVLYRAGSRDDESQGRPVRRGPSGDNSRYSWDEDMRHTPSGRRMSPEY